MPLKVYNGSSWVSASGLKVYNGSSWVSATNGNVWDGSSWVPFFNSVLDTFTLTAGIGSLEVVKGNPIVSYGYLSSDYPNFSGGVSPAGSLDNYTFAPTNSTIVALTYFSGDFSSQLEFWVEGEHPNSGWNTITVYHNYTGTTTVLNRTDFAFESYPASEAGPGRTYWIKASGNIFPNTTGGQNTYLITVT